MANITFIKKISLSLSLRNSKTFCLSLRLFSLSLIFFSLMLIFLFVFGSFGHFLLEKSCFHKQQQHYQSPICTLMLTPHLHPISFLSSSWSVLRSIEEGSQETVRLEYISKCSVSLKAEDKRSNFLRLKMYFVSLFTASTSLSKGGSWIVIRYINGSV